MAVVQLTSDGIQRVNVTRTEFFDNARNTLIKAGFETTTWVDYLIGRKDGRTFFVTIRKSNIMVADASGVLFTTRVLRKVVDILAI